MMAEEVGVEPTRLIKTKANKNNTLGNRWLTLCDSTRHNETSIGSVNGSVNYA